jgi:hypothetical protein
MGHTELRIDGVLGSSADVYGQRPMQPAQQEGAAVRVTLEARIVPQDPGVHALSLGGFQVRFQRVEGRWEPPPEYPLPPRSQILRSSRVRSVPNRNLEKKTPGPSKFIADSSPLGNKAKADMTKSVTQRRRANPS